MDALKSQIEILDRSIELRRTLQTATVELHNKLDRQFEEFDLTLLTGYRLFLQAHLLSALQYQDLVSGFCADILGCSLPDYPAILRADLNDAGGNEIEVEFKPVPRAATRYEQAGVTYVILGSRLGTAHLHKHFASKLRAQVPSLALGFMSEHKGIECWRAFLRWCNTEVHCRSAREEAIISARDTFSIFSESARQVQLAYQAR